MTTRLIMALICLSAALAGSAQALSVPRDTSFTRYSTNIKIHKHHPEAVLASDTIPQGLKMLEDEVYETFPDSPYGRRDLHADVIRPDNDSILPAVIMVHGGGWNSGDKTLQRALAVRIAGKGYVAVPIEYRLIPEALYPAGLHDVKTAVRYFRKHAARYGVDPSRIAVGGSSAGAQLATLVGVTNGSARHEGAGSHADASSDVQAILNYDGVCTFLTEDNLADVKRRFDEKGQRAVSVIWLGGFLEEAPDNWKEASALEWITPQSAPICIVGSGFPRFTYGKEAFLDEYQSHGIPGEYHQIPVDVHPFWFFDPWIDTAAAYGVSFLDRILKGKE